MRTVPQFAVYSAILLILPTVRAQDATRGAKITPEGRRLAKTLDQLDVEHLWLSGKSVKWRTGEPLDKPVTVGKSHTHCSAFAAAAAEKLGIYILRPPKHSSALLANAQYDWLGGDGRNEGWTPATTGLEAQKLANEGQLVVAVYKEKDPKKPGHIAIIRPSIKSEAKIREEGPQIIQAGMENHASTSLKEGFKHHKGAFGGGLIRFYTHTVPAKKESTK
jgi:hypothetical protein